jgi:hypothetical protein
VEIGIQPLISLFVMTIVEGQIESLKELKKILNQSGITRFNSITEINIFIKNYNSEKNRVPKTIKNTLDNEIKDLQSDFFRQQKIYKDLKTNISNEISQNIKNLEEILTQARDKGNRNLFNKILFFPKILIFSNKKSRLRKNFDKIMHETTTIAEHEVIKSKNKLDKYIENKEQIISKRCMQSYKELDYTKEVVDSLYTLIAGAIGENSVVKELQKLPDNYILINDYSRKFNPPIYNRKENDRILSIQVDHLLICNAGIFVLETKNWSKQSISNYHLRSPVQQIMRTSYALFALLNSDSKYNKVQLDRHHWGNKQIPVRNLIVMIHEKPKEVFKHVKVLSLKELVGYITYFDEIFSDAEVKNIADYLRVKSIDIPFDDFKCI